MYFCWLHSQARIAQTPRPSRSLHSRGHTDTHTHSHHTHTHTHTHTHVHTHTHAHTHTHTHTCAYRVHAWSHKPVVSNSLLRNWVEGKLTFLQGSLRAGSFSCRLLGSHKVLPWWCPGMGYSLCWFNMPKNKLLKKSIPARNVWKKIFQNFSVCCAKANGHWPFHLIPPYFSAL